MHSNTKSSSARISASVLESAMGLKRLTSTNRASDAKCSEPYLSSSKRHTASSAASGVWLPELEI